MVSDKSLARLPNYQAFSDRIGVLNLPVSASELHGVMCGYLCAGAEKAGESYLRALTFHKKEEGVRDAQMALFQVYTLSQQQINALDFEFQLLLPDDEQPLSERAEAFSQWCEGFTQGLTMAGIDMESFEEESQETLQHIYEFAELDCETLDISEEDESALMEVSEYTRMAVLRLHSDILTNQPIGDKGRDTAH